MKATLPYLVFNGNCREAITFYQSCLGGNLEVMSFAAAGFNDLPNADDLVVHACLLNGDLNLMASDCPPDQPVTIGSNVSVYLECEAPDEVGRLYDALLAGGEDVMAPHDAFWGARFAMLKDRFGVHWMLSHGPEGDAKA